VRRVAPAVDFSGRTIDAVLAADANFLILHHGMFWGGAQRITGQVYERLHRLIQHDVAVYASHLPLDAHPLLGNNARLAAALGLEPTERFGAYEGVPIGVAGETSLTTAELLARADAFATKLAGAPVPRGWTTRQTQRWAIITGRGARRRSAAQARGIDTLIVGGRTTPPSMRPTPAW
jgi:putative NIF3 family GTP cyclohydrolase 1 type 2